MAAWWTFDGQRPVEARGSAPGPRQRRAFGRRRRGPRSGSRAGTPARAASASAGATRSRSRRASPPRAASGSAPTCTSRASLADRPATVAIAVHPRAARRSPPGRAASRRAAGCGTARSPPCRTGASPPLEAQTGCASSRRRTRTSRASWSRVDWPSSPPKVLEHPVVVPPAHGSPGGVQRPGDHAGAGPGDARDDRGAGAHLPAEGPGPWRLISPLFLSSAPAMSARPADVLAVSQAAQDTRPVTRSC